MAKKLTITERVLSAINQTGIDYDHPSLAKAQAWVNDWRPENGTKPTPAMLWVGAATKKHGMGLEGMFIAMQLRPEGATVQSFMRATGAGGAAHNNTRALCKAGYFDRLKTQGPGQSETFTLQFTEAGERLINELLVTHGLKKAKPVKTAKPVKVKAKANKAKAAPVTEAVTEAVDTAPEAVAPEAVSTETATPETVAALAAHFNS